MGAMNPTLRTVLYLWKCTFMGFVLGLAMAWLLSKNTWLDMRVTTGAIIPWVALAGLALGVHTAWRPHRLRRRTGNLSSHRLGRFTLVALVAVPLLAAWGNWRDAIPVIPAALVRDALPGFAPLAAINRGLLVLLILGVPVLFFDPERYCCGPTLEKLDGGRH